MDITEHYQKMDHELERVNVSIEKYGYKIDGKDGIKQKCGLDRLKAADYIDDQTTRIAFVEFSDIARQYHRLLGEVEVINNLSAGHSGKDKRICIDVSKAHLDKVPAEVMQKFKDSLQIIIEAKSRYKNLPASFDHKPFALLVIAPPSDDDEPYRQDDIYRLLDQLQNRVMMNLPEAIFSGFRLLNIENYALV